MTINDGAAYLTIDFLLPIGNRHPASPQGQATDGAAI